MQVFLLILGVLLALLGVVMVYDARIITEKFFSFGDLNEASLGLKMLGFLIAIIGGLLCYFNI